MRPLVLKGVEIITERGSLSYGMYLNDIKKEELIPPFMEVELAQRIKKGDEYALELLIKANLRFVVSVAKQYQNQGLSLPDLINEGNLGLIKAAERFDETLGFKFISYAVWWIRQSILQSLAEHSRIVRLPFNKIGTAGKIKKVFSQFEQEHERPPTDEELMVLLGISSEQFYACLLKSKHSSLNDPLFEGDDGEVADNLIDEYGSDPKAIEDLDRQIIKSNLLYWLDQLPKQEKQILVSLYGIDCEEKSYEQLAEEMSLSVSKIRCLESTGIRRIKLMMKKVKARA